VLNLAVGVLSKPSTVPIQRGKCAQPLPAALAALGRLLGPVAAKCIDGGRLEVLSLARGDDGMSALLDCTMAGAAGAANPSRVRRGDAPRRLRTGSTSRRRDASESRRLLLPLAGRPRWGSEDAMSVRRTGKDGGTRRRIAPPVLRDGKAHCPRCGARLRRDYGVFACISCGYAFEAESEKRQWIEEPSTGHAA
jgi:hypothetical protein